MKTARKICFIVLLLCVSAVGSIASGATTPAPGFTFTHNLTLGTRGDEVSALQQLLIAGGFLKVSIPSGYFGPATKAALGVWQTKSGIRPSTGFFGPASRGKINAAVEQALIDAIRVPSTVVTTTSAAVTTTTAVATTSPGVVVKIANGSPVRLKIPKFNIDAGFQYNGLKPDGSMEVPNNIFDVGWFTGSPHPGEKGSAVVTGHVAQIRGGILTKPGVFNNLYMLRPGDEINVLNDRGEFIHFIVRESRSYDPAADATDVFTSKDDRAHLNLITCEGTWNPGQLSYSQRLVVFADATQ